MTEYQSSLGNIKLRSTPTKAASPMPDNEKSPQLKAAPPMPTVSVKDTMIIFLVLGGIMLLLFGTIACAGIGNLVNNCIDLSRTIK